MGGAEHDEAESDTGGLTGDGAVVVIEEVHELLEDVLEARRHRGDTETERGTVLNDFLLLGLLELAGALTLILSGSSGGGVNVLEALQDVMGNSGGA
jgi:hypothetical protein